MPPLVLLWLACLAPAADPLPVVPDVQLRQLSGRYFEVATYLQWVEIGCRNSSLTFQQQGRATGVRLECDRGSNHPSAEGHVTVPDASRPGHTIVEFAGPVGPIKVTFDVIMLGPNYSWLVLGHPSRRALWILSRRPALPRTTLDDIIGTLEARLGYRGVRRALTCTPHEGQVMDICRSALRPGLATGPFFDDSSDGGLEEAL